MPKIDYSTGMISRLKPDEVFVFGSNLAARHGGGAALQAKNEFGAKYGCGFGHCGQSFAIPTKDMEIQTMDPNIIALHVTAFNVYAIARPELKFCVTQIGTGLAGIPHNVMAKMFWGSVNTDNILFDRAWRDMLPPEFEDKRFWNESVNVW